MNNCADGVRRTIVLAGLLLVLTSCGSSTVGDEQATAEHEEANCEAVGCDGGPDEIATLLSSGLPTHDYEPTSEVTELISQSDAVATGSIDSVVRSGSEVVPDPIVRTRGPSSR